MMSEASKYVLDANLWASPYKIHQKNKFKKELKLLLYDLGNIPNLLEIRGLGEWLLWKETSSELKLLLYDLGNIPNQLEIRGLGEWLLRSQNGMGPKGSAKVAKLSKCYCWSSPASADILQLQLQNWSCFWNTTAVSPAETGTSKGTLLKAIQFI